MEKKFKKIEIHNCHTHTFLFEDAPTKFLPLGLVRFLAKRGWGIARFLNKIDPTTDGDVYDRYANFIRIIKCPTQEQTFEYLSRFYPKNAKFVILAMDMQFMGAGNVGREYTKQLDELSKLKKKYPNRVYPFIGVDPRRANIEELVKEYIEDHNFCGIKLYPPLGYFPYDSTLMPIYQYAQSHGIPIIAHSSKSGPIYCRLKKKELISKIKNELDPSTGIRLHFEGKSRKELCNYFTHPKNYKVLLNKFESLKVCLAHFGGASQWQRFLNPSTIGVCEKMKKKEYKNIDTDKDWFSIIYDMLKDHKSLYTDISFTLENRDFFPLLKVLLSNSRVREQILFGSDFYMTEVSTSERSFGIDLHGVLGTEDFKLIAQTNPRLFLSNCLHKSIVSD